MKAIGVASAAVVALLPTGLARPTPTSNGVHGYVWMEQTPQCRAEPCEDPLPGAKVVATAADGGRSTAVTNARGFYRLAVAPGRYSVTPDVPGAGRPTLRRVLIRSGANGRLDFHLASRHQ